MGITACFSRLHLVLYKHLPEFYQFRILGSGSYSLACYQLFKKKFPAVIVSRYISAVCVPSLVRCAGGIFLLLHLS